MAWAIKRNAGVSVGDSGSTIESGSDVSKIHIR